MECPRCHSEKNDGESCFSCGVIFSKFISTEKHHPEQVNQPKDQFYFASYGDKETKGPFSLKELFIRIEEDAQVLDKVIILNPVLSDDWMSYTDFIQLECCRNLDFRLVQNTRPKPLNPRPSNVSEWMVHDALTKANIRFLDEETGKLYGSFNLHEAVSFLGSNPNQPFKVLNRRLWRGHKTIDAFYHWIKTLFEVSPRKPTFEGPFIRKERKQKDLTSEFERTYNESLVDYFRDWFVIIQKHLLALKRKYENIHVYDDFGFIQKDAKAKWMEAKVGFLARVLEEKGELFVKEDGLGYKFPLWLIDFLLVELDPPTKEDAPLKGEEFENWVQSKFQDAGVTARTTKKSGDQGIDVIVDLDSLRWGIQCKRYSKKVDNTPIQEVVAGLPYYGCDRGAVIATSGYTNSAKELANANNVILCSDLDFIEKLGGDELNPGNSLLREDKCFEIFQASMHQNWETQKSMYAKGLDDLRSFEFKGLVDSLLLNEFDFVLIQARENVSDEVLIKAFDYILTHGGFSLFKARGKDNYLDLKCEFDSELSSLFVYETDPYYALFSSDSEWMVLFRTASRNMNVRCLTEAPNLLVNQTHDIDVQEIYNWQNYRFFCEFRDQIERFRELVFNPETWPIDLLPQPVGNKPSFCFRGVIFSPYNNKDEAIVFKYGDCWAIDLIGTFETLS